MPLRALARRRSDRAKMKDRNSFHGRLISPGCHIPPIFGFACSRPPAALVQYVQPWWPWSPRQITSPHSLRPLTTTLGGRPPSRSGQKSTARPSVCATSPLCTSCTHSTRFMHATDTLQSALKAYAPLDRMRSDADAIGAAAGTAVSTWLACRRPVSKCLVHIGQPSLRPCMPRSPTVTMRHCSVRAAPDVKVVYCRQACSSCLCIPQDSCASKSVC